MIIDLHLHLEMFPLALESDHYLEDTSLHCSRELRYSGPKRRFSVGSREYQFSGSREHRSHDSHWGFELNLLS
jgi:hypothetical protein